MSNRILTHLLKANYISGFVSKVNLQRDVVGSFVGTRRKSCISNGESFLVGHRSFCTKKDGKEKETETIRGSISDKYAPFQDRQRVVQDVVEEEWDPIEEEFEAPVKKLYERGKTGVFDVGELVEILEEERGLDVCVIKIPVELDYADFMIIVTARSPRHMHALATFVRKRFKSKDLKPSDRLPRIEGKVDTTDWIAIDLGNIVLHIFTEETRERLCLETLWTVGYQYDDLYHQKDSEIVQLLNLFR